MTKKIKLKIYLQYMKKRIITIGWGNGHSHILSALSENLSENISLSAVVSMSDDGRTTGKLMRLFEQNFSLYLPPTWDIRKCLYSLSWLDEKEILSFLFENKFRTEQFISSFTLEELSRIIIEELYQENKWLFGDEKEDKLFKKKEKLFKKIQKLLGKTSDYILQLDEPLLGHKFGNIMMALIFYNFWDYQKMLDFMHEFFSPKWKVIPVTFDRATIQDVLANGEIIYTQDAISNIAEYNDKISHLELSSDSKWAYHTEDIKKSIWETDYIFVTPWDLYTSTISNLIIGWIKDLIKNSQAPIIYAVNNTNKWGETTGYKVMDFVEEVEKYLGKSIDVLIVNNKVPELDKESLENLKQNISVQWGDFIYLTDEERRIFKERGVKIYEDDFIDREFLYKHHKKNIAKVLKKVIF